MESARDIFDSCCAEIAAGLAEAGFQYRHSKHSAIKVDGDLKFEIHFQSSPRNYLVPRENAGSLTQLASKVMPFGDWIAFGNVTLIEHALVYSKALKQFRKSIPNAWRVDDSAMGGQIGNLQSPPKWVTFNLANPYTRAKLLVEARQLIDHVALPYFELFKNPANVVGRLLDGSMSETWEPVALEYVCCFGSKDQARRLLNRFIHVSSAQATEYRDFLVRFSSEGLPLAWDSTSPGRLAKAAIILGLD